MRLTYQPVGQQEVIDARGTPSEQGMAIGRATAALIAANVSSDREGIRQALTSSNARDFWRILTDQERYMARVEPDLLEEIEATAHAAALPYYELLFINFFHLSRAYRSGQQCSTFLARRPATADGKTYVAKTNDVEAPFHYIAVRRAYPEGRQVLEVNAAGMPLFPPAGINDAGLAIVNAGVWTQRMPRNLSRAHDAYLMPNLRMLLRRAKSVDEMIALLRDTPHMAGVNLAAADANRGVAVEVTDEAVYVAEDDRGIACRTNHYLTPEIAHLGPSPEENQSTYRRYRRLTALLSEHRGCFAFREALLFLSDHEEGPEDGICRHQVECGGHLSQFAAVMIVEERELWTTLVNPCDAIKRLGIN